MWIQGGKWISKITRKSTLSSILALFRNIEKYKLVIWPEYSISLPNHNMGHYKNEAKSFIIPFDKGEGIIVLSTFL